MRPVYALVLLGLSILSSGCALIEDSNRNLFVALSTPIETHREMARNRSWAEAAWQKERCTQGFAERTEDYAQGFKEGYAEFLFRGGDGEPPLVAPLRYRHIRYQNANGYLAIENWFAGYRHGAAIARDTGARSWVTGPSGLQSAIPKNGTHDPQSAIPTQLNQELPEVIPAPPKLVPMSMQEENSTTPMQLTIGVLESPQDISDSLPEPMKIKILQVREAPETLKAKITGISVAPSPAPANEPQVVPEPVRARITTIRVVSPKD